MYMLLLQYNSGNGYSLLHSTRYTQIRSEIQSTTQTETNSDLETNSKSKNPDFDLVFLDSESIFCRFELLYSVVIETPIVQKRRQNLTDDFWSAIFC